MSLAHANKGDILIDATNKSEYEVLAVLDNLLFIRYLSGIIDCAPTFNTRETLEANGFTIRKPEPEECKYVTRCVNEKEHIENFMKNRVHFCAFNTYCLTHDSFDCNKTTEQ